MRLLSVNAHSACLVVGLLLLAASGGRLALSLTLVLTVPLAWWATRAAEFVNSKSKQVANVKFVLHSMRLSHFSEKVRWCLEQAHADFVEEADVGLLGVTLLWRQVPQLKVLARGAKPYTVPDSSHCVAALHSALLLDGRDPQELAWLQIRPGDQQLEKQIGKMGFCVQHIYYGELLDSSLGSQVAVNNNWLRLAWGLKDQTLPAWQRLMGNVMFAAMQAFARMAFPPQKRNKSWERASQLLQEFETIFSDGRQYIHGADLSFLDISLAAINYSWALQTLEHKRLFSNGADGDQFASLPECAPVNAMAKEFSERFPKTHSHAVMMYEKHRRPS